MSSQSETSLRKQLRGYASATGNRSIIVKLGSLRKQMPAQNYNILINVFKTTTPLKARFYMSGGRRNYSEILYQSNIETLSLANEIKFCTAWVMKHHTEINLFLRFSEKIQTEILSSELSLALSNLESFIERHGWSIWATELYFFLYKTVHGFDKLKEQAEVFVKKSSPRISSLFFSCLLDRNDDNYSVDAFYSKWKSIFSSISQKALRDYLSYRAVTQIDDLENGMASALSVDILNSIYDCYETLIDACSTAIIDRLSTEAIDSAIMSLQNLIDCGIQDTRLHKTLLLTGTINLPDHDKIKCQSEDSEVTTSGLSHDQPFNLRALKQDILENGYDAEESLSKILHLGVNLKVLNFGSELINLVFKESENDILSTKLYQWECVHRKYFGLEDCTALEINEVVPYLDLLSIFADEGNAKKINIIKDIVNGNAHASSVDLLGEELIFWLGITLVKLGRYKEINDILLELDLKGAHWARESKKLYLVQLVATEQLELAIITAVQEITKKKKLGSQLTLPLIFKDRKWKDFIHIDPILVGVVAFCSNSVESQANVLHICRMACRAIYKKNNSLEVMWQEATAQRKSELRYFFKNVWVEENLSLTDISTSQQARLERIEILHILFTLDSENEKEYAEEIKTLTLHQTLWLGLKHIDESRIFVNEPAILRWAEKELSLDYDRWKRTETMPPDDSIIKNAIKKFFSENPDESATKTAISEMSSEQDVLIISIVERLIEKFLLDPADGMNSYLSSRVRHGSLKGTILGPLEEDGLLLTSASVDELESKYLQNLCSSSMGAATSAMIEFSRAVSGLIDYANKEIIRIHSIDTPNGKIFIALDRPAAAKLYTEAAKVSNLSAFTGLCFETFWVIASKSLGMLSEYFTVDFKHKILLAFNELLDKIESLGEDFEALLSGIRAASTATQLQCDVVASWFLPVRELEQKVFSLDETIEIALRSTRNVYRLFNAKISIEKSGSLELSLTAYGLTTIFDCLYVILENAWKHSGLGSEHYNILTDFSFDSDSRLLCIEIKNPLSQGKLDELRAWRLAEIKKKYQEGSSLEFVPSEGGSGIPKLAKLSRFADMSLCEPLNIYIDDMEFFSVKVYIPLYKRGDAYDAYYQ